MHFQVSLATLATDITRAKTREQEIERLLGEAQNFIDVSNAPIFSVDGDFNIVDWNRKASELSAFPREEVQGLPLLDLIEPQLKAGVARGGALKTPLENMVSTTQNTSWKRLTTR